MTRVLEAENDLGEERHLLHLARESVRELRRHLRSQEKQIRDRRARIRTLRASLPNLRASYRAAAKWEKKNPAEAAARVDPTPGD